MIILVTLGALLALAGGLGVVIARRDRRSRSDVSESGESIQPPDFQPPNFKIGEYFPPPDDGRPQH